MEAEDPASPAVPPRSASPSLPSPSKPGLSAEAVGPAPPRGTQDSPLVGIFITIFLDLIGFSIIFPLFPSMLDHYLALEGRDGFLGAVLDLVARVPGGRPEHITVLFGGFLGSLYSLLQFLAAPWWGALSDRIGRKPVLTVTVAGITLSYVLWFFSGSFLLLVLARLLGGVMSGNISTATAAVADSTTEATRGKGMAIIGVAFGLGFILGPALGGFLSLVDLTKLAPGLVPLGVNPFSAAAAGAFLLSAANLLYLLRRFHETRPRSQIAPAHTIQRTANILKLFAPLGIRGANRANALWFVYLAAFSGMEFTLTFLAAERFSFSPHQTGYLFVFVGLIIAFVQGGVVRQWLPILGEKALTILGLAAVIPGFVFVGVAANLRIVLLGLGLMAFGSALVTPCLTAMVSLYSPPDRQGRVLGVFRSLGALARATGPLLACVLYWTEGSRSAYLVMAMVLVAPLLLALSLPRPPLGARVSPPP